MPTNGKVTFTVMIGGRDVPEYTKDGQNYVESDLFTPFSYEQEVRELVDGEVEAQKWPVTPYEIKVYLHPKEEMSSLCLHIDGVRVGIAIVYSGSSHVFRGFEDVEGTKEFLFSLPRFASDELDRVATNRLSKIGQIKVFQYSLTYAYTGPLKSRSSDTSFNQANKKDARGITGGAHTLSTTKKGRTIASYNYVGGTHEYWNSHEFVSEVSATYMMGYTLQEKGIKLKPAPWAEN